MYIAAVYIKTYTKVFTSKYANKCLFCKSDYSVYCMYHVLLTVSRLSPPAAASSVHPDSAVVESSDARKH